MSAMKMRIKRTIVIRVAAVVVILSVTALSLLFVSLFTRPSEEGPAEDVIIDLSEEDVDLIGRNDDVSDEDSRELKKRPGAYTYILGGTSSFGLTDTLALLYYEPEKNIINVMQIPRDTYVTYTGGSSKKINSAYAYKGAEGLKKCIRHTFGIEVDGYLVIGTKAFRDAVDAIGGVTVNVPMDMYYEDPFQDLLIDLKKGEQVLNGAKAEQFVRFRKGYANQDLGRMQAQRTFVAAFIKKLLTFDGAVKIPAMVDSIFKNIRTDLSAAELITLATDGISIGMSKINIYDMPYELSKGGSYMSIYGPETIDLINRHFNPYTRDLVLEDVNITELIRTKTYSESAHTVEDVNNTVLKLYKDPKYVPVYYNSDGSVKNNSVSATKPTEQTNPTEPAATQPVKTEKPKVYLRYCCDADTAQKIIDYLKGAGFTVDSQKLTIAFDVTEVHYSGAPLELSAIKNYLTASYIEKTIKEGYSYEIYIGKDFSLGDSE